MLEQGKGWFDSIAGRPLKDRIFVLMLFIIFLLVGTIVTLSMYFRDREYETNRKREEAEIRVDNLREVILKDNKEYSDLLRQERQDCDDKWKVKFENERELSRKLLEEKAKSADARAERFEKEIIELSRKTQNLKNEANKLKQIIKK